MPGADLVVRRIGAGGPLATKLADVICRLVRQGAELGELEPYFIVDAEARARGIIDAPMLKRHRLPRAWLDRLAQGIETDAVSRFSADEIVALLLQGR